VRGRAGRTAEDRKASGAPRGAKASCSSARSEHRLESVEIGLKAAPICSRRIGLRDYADRRRIGAIPGEAPVALSVAQLDLSGSTAAPARASRASQEPT
jgi:hypothetical protein